MSLSIAMPQAVIRRFPHLSANLEKMAMENEEFFSLCSDYSSIIRVMDAAADGSGGQKDELVNLKSALELEILERLSVQGR